MAQTRDIRIKVTSNQFEIIKNNANNDGHKTISSYIRQRILNKNDEIEEMLKKIYEELNKKKII